MHHSIPALNGQHRTYPPVGGLMLQTTTTPTAPTTPNLASSTTTPTTTSPTPSNSTTTTSTTPILTSPTPASSTSTAAPTTTSPTPTSSTTTSATTVPTPTISITTLTNLSPTPTSSSTTTTTSPTHTDPSTPPSPSPSPTPIPNPESFETYLLQFQHSGIHAVPGPSQAPHSSEFQLQHLQRLGFFNEQNTCAVISILQMLHRAQIANFIQRPSSTSNVRQDYPILMLLQYLDALPSLRAFTLKALKDVWNDSSSAYKIVPHDDIHSASDGIFSMIASKLNQGNIFSEYRVAYQCPRCSEPDIVSHVNFEVIPQIHMPDQPAPISISDLLDGFLFTQVALSCSRCSGPARGTVIPHFGKLKPICFNRRPDYIRGVQQRKIETKLSLTESIASHNIGEIIGVINHRGDLKRLITIITIQKKNIYNTNVHLRF